MGISVDTRTYWIWKKSKNFRLSLFLVIATSALGITFSLEFANLTKVLINDGEKFHRFSIYGIILLILYKVLQLLFEQSEIFLRSYIRAKLENKLVYQTSLKFLQLDILTSQRYNTGDKLFRVSNDASTVAECIASNVPVLIYSIILFLSTAVYLFLQDARLTIVLCLLTPITLVFCFAYSKYLISAEKKVRNSGSEIISKLQEYFRNHELLSIYNAVSYAISIIYELQKKYLRLIKTKIKLIIGFDSISEGCLTISYLIIIIWGIRGIAYNTVNFGEFIVFLQLVGQIQRPFFLFKDQISSVIGACASIDRLMEIENLKKWDTDKMIQVSAEFDTIVFSNISFSYSRNSNPILKNFNLTIKKGEFICIIGRTGIGKTSLFKLLLGILTPTEGDIYFNISGSHIPISNSTYSNFAYVPQGNSLINGTIRHNLLLANPNATDEMIEKALYKSCAEFVLLELPEGLDTIVGEKGMGLSEGQAQRIAIARGILCERPVLLLDEPTASLDYETENMLMNRLADSQRDFTIIMITHQNSLSGRCDSIINLNNMKII